MKILDRYLSLEIVLPFLIGLAGFLLLQIGTILFNGLIELMIQAQTPVRLVALALFYKLPHFIVLALPIATLFGVSLGVNRLAREGEINAMRVAGVSLRRILVPLMGVGLLVSILDYAIQEKIVPPTNIKAEEIISRMWIESAAPRIEPDVFFHAGKYWFYLGSVTKNADKQYTLERVMMYELKPGGYPKLTTAEVGKINGTHWALYNLLEVEFVNGEERILTSPRMELNMEQGIEQYLTTQHKPEGMSTQELASMIERFGEGKGTDILKMHYYLKYSIPIGCLVVVLVSTPFAVHYARSGSFVGILLSIVLFFFYYNTYFFFRMLGSANTLPPLVAAWGHNVIFAAIGLVMLWREE